ncbi:MAG: cobalamin-dependent protein [Ardenticatenales bacterium]|nr:cobalamin-dependent protein [Ardenticatenales bacterium]
MSAPATPVAPIHVATAAHGASAAPTPTPTPSPNGVPAHEPYHPRHKLRIVTAASLFDGHDAAINIMRRILQASGAEVIHLGHNRSVQDIVDAAIQEDAQGIALSSYQGGHMEYFKYAYDMLAERGCGHIRIFGGGGGTIIPEEKRELEAYGIAAIFHPEDGRRMGLQGMINEVLKACDHRAVDLGVPTVDAVAALDAGDWPAIARLISAAESATGGDVGSGIDVGGDTGVPTWPALSAAIDARIAVVAASRTVPVVGMTGTGGAGKSSFTDEFVRRYVEDFPDHRVAILSVDPTKRLTGGALLGDRIRMNVLSSGRVYMRSLATRSSGSEISAALDDAIRIARAAGFDLIVAETSGIGQADAGIIGLCDVAVYVMTPEFGAQTQLEKIEMIDLADIVIVNKYDKPGGEDALRDVRKAYQRSHNRWHDAPDSMPVYATISSHFGDPGCNTAYARIVEALAAKVPGAHIDPAAGRFASHRTTGLPDLAYIIPPRRANYLLEISETVKRYKARARDETVIADDLWALRVAIRHFVGGPDPAVDPAALEPFGAAAVEAAPAHIGPLMAEFDVLLAKLAPTSRQLLADWPATRARYRAPENRYTVRGREIVIENTTESLSHTRVPKIALPPYVDWGNVLAFRLLDNLPGFFPYVAGVFPYKRTGEDPTRMFAGEGGPWRTNKRFHYLSRHADAKRLSTAFDSVTLYGEDPDPRPDIWGKVGNSGVSIATVEDIEALYAGFDLCDPRTSVSMTINGPAPTILAFYFNAAVRQQLRKKLKAEGRIEISDADCLQPMGGGHRFRDLREMIGDDEYDALVDATVAQVRGTVQADILKEDQGQNTCIFSTEFSLKVMGDVQQWFIDHDVRNFYSVSISGYHIAEAGANPISQLAFTLSNGFTFVEYYLSRGMKIDDFAPNLSFFFSNGMDPEYAVIGRVARRIWATAMRDLYGANERSQMLKYHIQTSGRSLHAQEIQFNDIRTTLQALLAVYDNCNSLHTNAYDEAITTPTEESVRRAIAIQLILNREFGVAKNENPNQGSFIIDALTDLVEEAVLAEFERISARGGVLGAMERGYQRSKIQEESLYYEELKHSGALPIIGVNTFLPVVDAKGDGAADGVDGESDGAKVAVTTIELMRSTDEEKADQLARLRDYHARHVDGRDAAVERLKAAAIRQDNVFGELMRAVETLSLGQVSRALYEVGGQYRRNM